MANSAAYRTVAELLHEGIVWNGREDRRGIAVRRAERSAPFEIPEIDAVLPGGGLALQAVHELAFSTNAPNERAKKRWVAPFFFLSLLVARQILRARGCSALWIGRKCFPAPHVFEDVRRIVPSWDWRGSSFFIDTPGKEERLWSTLEALRCRGVGTIVSDGSFLPFVATRRLQLAAAESRALFLLVRPPWEIHQHSAAQTKWLISPSAPASTLGERSPPKDLRGFSFSLELVRARGMSEGARWTCEWKSGRYGTKNLVTVSADTVDGSRSEPAEEKGRRAGGR